MGHSSLILHKTLCCGCQLESPRHEKTVFFAYAKTKTHMNFAVTAKLISSFVFATRIVQSLYFLNPKFQASSHLLWLYRLVCVGPGRKPRRPVFSQRGSNIIKYASYLFWVVFLELLACRYCILKVLNIRLLYRFTLLGECCYLRYQNVKYIRMGIIILKIFIR